MVFVRDGCPEQSKDTVAQRLGHIAVIAMDGVHHQLERGVDDGSRVLRIGAFDQCRRAFEIGKESRDGFPLAVRCATRLHRRLFGPDTLGQVLGGCSWRAVGIQLGQVRCWKKSGPARPQSR